MPGTFIGANDVRAPADDYLHWVHSVAEARWANAGVSELPWWIQANHVDEIADADRHPDATTFDGLGLAEERAELELGDFAARFEAASGNALDDLASRFRSPEQVRGRIELSALAAGRYGLRVRDIAALINKHRNSVTKHELRKPPHQNLVVDIHPTEHHLSEVETTE